MVPLLRTFSILSTTGGGLAAVTAAAISAPIRNASSRDRPGNSTNMLSAGRGVLGYCVCVWEGGRGAEGGERGADLLCPGSDCALCDGWV